MILLRLLLFLFILQTAKKKKVNISSSVFFYTWVVLQALSNSSHSSASELSRECCLAGLSDTDPPASSWLHPLTDHDSLARLMQERRAQQQHSCHYQRSHRKTQALFGFTLSPSLTNIQRNTTTGCFGFTFLLGAAGGHGWQPGLREMLGNLMAGQSWKKFKENPTFYFIYHKMMNPLTLS